MSQSKGKSRVGSSRKQRKTEHEKQQQMRLSAGSGEERSNEQRTADKRLPAAGAGAAADAGAAGNANAAQVDAAASDETNGQRRAGIAAKNTEVVSKPLRRQFSTAYKLAILAEVDAATELGQIGAILRREGLYWGTLSRWRKWREAGRHKQPPAKPTGRKKDPATPIKADLQRAKRREQRLQDELKKAQLIIEAQRNFCELLGLSLADMAQQAEPGGAGEPLAKPLPSESAD